MTSHTHQSCIDALQKCAQQCEHCADHCLGTMADCARVCIDCADICWSTAAFLSRGSQFHEQLCRLCAEICDA